MILPSMEEDFASIRVEIKSTQFSLGSGSSKQPLPLPPQKAE
jgi:hypothetical protein